MHPAFMKGPLFYKTPPFYFLPIWAWGGLQIIIIIIIKGIYIAQVRKGHKCAMSAEMAVWLCNCLYLYSYLSHN